MKEFTPQRQVKVNELKYWPLIINICFCFEGAPEIAAPLNGFVDKEGGMVTLNCSALGHPAPQFTWKPSGKEVRECASNRLGLIFKSENCIRCFFHLCVCV